MARPVVSSGLKSSDSAIADGPCRLRAATILTDGSNDATLTVYDNASAASGTVVMKAKVAGADLTGHLALPGGGVACRNGLYADISGTNSSYIIYFEPCPLA